MFLKPNVLIFIQRNRLLVAGKRLPSTHVNFPEDIVHNLEVLQHNKLVDICRQFFTDKNLRRKRLQIVLDYSVVFEKTIELDQSGKPDILIEGFVTAMPFEPGKRSCLAVQTDVNLRLFATNAETYQAVSEALRAAQAGSLVAITPIAAYNLAENERTIRAATDHILKDSEVSKQVNFRDVIPS